LDCTSFEAPEKPMALSVPGKPRPGVAPPMVVATGLPFASSVTNCSSFRFGGSLGSVPK
jgi:hypothetical protein